MKTLLTLSAIVSLALFFLAPQASEAPAGFDNKSNGMVDAATHTADQTKFEETEAVADGLGPLYNAQSCRECHQNPTSGGSSQVSELRVGHKDAKGQFQNPEIAINHGAEIIKSRSLINDRAICPSGAFPNTEIQEHVPDTENIRTFRISVNLLGDGFVEAVADQTFVELAKEQCKKSRHKICGQVLYVPIVEAPGQTGVGRFGWKDQQASLLSFSADAYLNEMGITNRLQPDEVTNLCNTASEPNDTPGADGLSDIDHFARFMRATEAPARDQTLAQSPEAKHGEALFDKIGCATCHISTLTTASAGTAINGGTFTIPPALGDKSFHPYGDFLLHNIGTGDGIVQSMTEHYGKKMYSITWKNLSIPEFGNTANKMRTAPLWGLRLHSRLMHDGASLTFTDAILRHRGEAAHVTKEFKRLRPAEKAALLEFLRSL
ncbi:MAG TPA: di-heme oxidoredictase family protein [Candidatus Acidoferrales bacterium]|nr:di-heme oxidoredictase family protein [Candidatus Acidoferrales bacterium]